MGRPTRRFCAHRLNRSVRWPAPSQKVSVGAVFVASMFMNIMDSTIVNVAVPTLARQFDVPVTSVGAVVVAYLVSLAVFIPASGWLGDRFGTKRVLLVAVALFTGASALCGAADSLLALIAFRILQGAAGGLLTPVALAMLLRTFPQHERMQASRILIIPMVFAPALGPVLGGLLVDELSWRWIFFVNVPIGVAVLLFGLVFVREHREPNAGRFDGAGFALAGLGLGLLMFAISEGPGYGWSSPVILATLLGGLLVLGLLVPLELRRPEPLLELRLLADRLFAINNVVSLLAAVAFLGSLYVFPLYLQDGRGTSALTAGLATFPEAIGVMVCSQLVAQLYPRVGPRRLIAGGLLGVTVCTTLLGLAGANTDLWVLRGLLFALGGAMAGVFNPIQTAAFATTSRAATGRASTIFNTQRQLGGALGVAALTTVLAIVHPTIPGPTGAPQPNLAAYHAAFLTAAGVALVAALIALTIRDADAEATMRRV